jgi:hypothetical protein
MLFWDRPDPTDRALGCDTYTCGSRWFMRVYRDADTGVSVRACWRRAHRATARTLLVRRAAVANAKTPPPG